VKFTYGEQVRLTFAANEQRKGAQLFQDALDIFAEGDVEAAEFWRMRASVAYQRARQLMGVEP
jgi:hypothetical protein